MGQSNSKASSLEATRVRAAIDADPPKASRPHSTSASGRIKAPRSRLMGSRRNAVESTDTVSYPHHQFIPKEQRQRSVGPIRSRPVPSEYAPRYAPLPPSFVTSVVPDREAAALTTDAGTSAFSVQPSPPKASMETAEAKSNRRFSAHRVSASPSHPPLFEESESNQDRLSVEDRRGAPPAATPSVSDHGYEPVSLSPSLACALKAGLGSGSLRRTPDGELTMQRQYRAPLASIPSQQTGHPSQDADLETVSAQLWGHPTPSQASPGWQSEWQDLRYRPSTEIPQQAMFDCADRAPVSRFSFGSSDPTTTSSANQSGAESARRDSSMYATTPLVTQRFSYTASESGDSAQHLVASRTPASDRRRSLPNPHSSSFNEARFASSLTHGDVSERRRSSHTHSCERSIRSSLSAAAASSDCDPTLSFSLHSGKIAPAINVHVPFPASDGVSPERIVHRAFDRYEDPAAVTETASQHLSPLRPSQSISVSSVYSGTKEVDKLRRGPEVKLHHDSIETVFATQPAAPARRPRALSLIDKLRGIKGKTAEASITDTNLVTVQAQPSLAAASSAGSMRTRLRSLSHVQGIGEPLRSSTTPAASTQIQSSSQFHQQPRQLSLPLVHSSDYSSRQSHGTTQGATGHSQITIGERRSSLFREPGVAKQATGLAQPDATGLSRPVSIRTVRSQRSMRSAKSFTSSSGSLRGLHRAGQLSTSRPQARHKASHPPTSSWWKQNHLKRKGSEGIVAEAQAAKQGRGVTGGIDSKIAEETGWVDVVSDSQAQKSNCEQTATSMAAPATVKSAKSKEHGSGLWIWPRRPSAARVFSLGLHRWHPGRGERVEAGVSPKAAEAERKEEQHSPVDVVGMTMDAPLTPPSGAFGSANVANLSQSSFTALAPPAPLTPVPPPRRPRRPSAQPMSRQDRSNSADSTFTVSLVDMTNGSSTHNLQQILAASETGHPPSATTGSSVVAGTALSSLAASSAAEEASSVATSVDTIPAGPAAFMKKAGGSRGNTPKAGYLTSSPAPTVSARLSEASDAGTKEILLSDRESMAAPKMSSDSFVRGPFDEQYPDLGGNSYSKSAGPNPSPLSRMVEEEPNQLPPRHNAAVADPSSRQVTGHQGGLGRGTHALNESLDETSRSFRSARSFRSTSDGSVRPYRPLPVAPVRSRGWSLGVGVDRRDPSYGAESYVTAASVDLPYSDRIDGLPAHDTQLSPLMLMGMVAAASPTSYTHSSHSHIDNEYKPELERSNTVSRASQVSGPRPLPWASSQNIDAAVELALAQSKGKGKSRATIDQGPPLSPSAFYESSLQVPSLPAGPRSSWTPADAPGSAAFASPASIAERGIRDLKHSGPRRALVQPFDDGDDGLHSSQCIASPIPIDEIEDAELTRLEKSRSGSKILPATRPPTTTELPDSLERAPYADTGVQASLAALRALESPGESVRTILARQRMFGERDASMTEFLRESRILDSEARFDDQEVLAVSGPRRRRRAEPYPSVGVYSSDEISSSGRSGRRRIEAARLRRRRNYTGMAEASSTSYGESGRGSDSESATLAAVRQVYTGLRDSGRERSDVAQTLSHRERQQRPRHQRYHTAFSQTDLAASSAPQDAVPRSDSAQRHKTSQGEASSPQIDTATQDDRMSRRMRGPRPRARSDMHTSSARSSKITRSDALEKSRYDAQIHDLLLLREKVLQLESSIGHHSSDHGHAGREYSVDDSARGKSSISSKRKSKSSKLGYTMADIVAWQAGLGSNSAKTTVA